MPGLPPRLRAIAFHGGSEIPPPATRHTREPCARAFSSRVPGRTFTCNSPRPVIPGQLARATTVALPARRAVTRPEGSTVATFGCRLNHVISGNSECGGGPPPDHATARATLRCMPVQSVRVSGSGFTPSRGRAVPLGAGSGMAQEIAVRNRIPAAVSRRGRPAGTDRRSPPVGSG